jgi:hypothetical protein
MWSELTTHRAVRIVTRHTPHHRRGATVARIERMRRTRAHLALVALATLAFSVGANAGARVSRIHYAEPVDLPGLPALPASGIQKPTGSARTNFEAFGRRFELQLESNDRVLRKLPSADRAALPIHALYAGTVVGLPGSWVRLTQLKNGVQGLVFDGSDLYVLAPAGSVQGELDTPLPGVAKAATLIYRAADVDSGLGADFCRVLQPPASGTASGGIAAPPPAYKAIFAELKANAPIIQAMLATKELDLALVGDTQLARSFANPTGEMLARLNNVDGIFSGQVGVRITSGFVTVLTSDAGMTATAADQLLDQFESYRRATPQAASRGLAHLMTGRELDGSTVGISYMSTLCASQFDVSLSQTYLDSFTSSLVAAHELGHNFGAPHDGASGSACAATPQTYLMAPAVNGSNLFSQCSLDQIAPVVRAAGCLAVPSIADVAVEIASASVSGYTNQDVHIPVDVVSKGTVSADQTLLTFSSSGFVTIASATVSGGTCTTAGCQLGTLAPGVRKQVDVVVRGSSPGLGEIRVSVTATGDADATNNNDGLSMTFTTPADGSLTASPTSITAYAGQTQSFSVTASNAGPLALEDASIVIQRPSGFDLVSAGGTGASCSTSFGATTCTLGSVPAGETRRIDVSTRATTATIGDFRLLLNSTNDSANGNNAAAVRFTALPNAELTLSAVGGTTAVPVGGTITRSFVLSSVAPQPVNGATFTASTGNEIDIVSASGTGAQCTADALTTHIYRCSYASAIESGGSRRIDVVLRGQTLGLSWINGSIYAPDSQHLPGSNADSVSVNLSVRSLVDVRLSPPGERFGYDHRSTTFYFEMTSDGATPASNVQFTLPLPSGVRATTASTGTGSCAVTAQSVTCDIGSLASGASNRVAVDVIADTVGTYSLPARIRADADTDPANDAFAASFQVQPNIDVAVLPLPADQHVRVAGTLDYTISVRTASQPVTGAYAMITTSTSAITILSATPSQGTCEPPAAQFSCTFGNLPANTSATVVLRLRGETGGVTLVRVDATATGDVDPVDGSDIGLLTVDPRGNVALQAQTTAVSTTVGTAFDYPAITLVAVARTEDVRVALTIPSSFSIESATADNAPCPVNAGNITCTFGTLDAGATRNIAVRLRANRSGTFPTTASATAADDSNMANNSASVSITVNKAASGGGGGGGGGGAFDPQATLLLLLLAPAVLRRRRARTG